MRTTAPGYAQIANDRFALANERFARATSIWPLKRWYYSYAEAFADKRQYLLAEHKYDDLLKAYPGDRKGTLDYARMESERLADYEKADSLLTQFLDAYHDDYDGLLAQGDNDLLWAQRDGTKLEPARAGLCNAHRQVWRAGRPALPDAPRLHPRRQRRRGRTAARLLRDEARREDRRARIRRDGRIPRRSPAPGTGRRKRCSGQTRRSRGCTKCTTISHATTGS